MFINYANFFVFASSHAQDIICPRVFLGQTRNTQTKHFPTQSKNSQNT